jgi:hypothetical protein
VACYGELVIDIISDAKKYVMEEDRTCEVSRPQESLADSLKLSSFPHLSIGGRASGV